MASSHPGLKKIGRFWHYNLKVNGERLHGSTRSTDLNMARMVLEEKRRELLNGQSNRPKKTLTTKELVLEWLSVHQSTFSRGHLRSAECALRRWVIPDIGGLPLSRVTSSEALSVRSSMLEKGCSGAYVNNTMRTLKAVFNYGVRTNYIVKLPFSITRIKVQKKPRAIVPISRIHEFLSAVDKSARNPHVPVMIRVMVGLGLRECEVLGMRYEWFDPGNQLYTVGKAKGKEARVIPMPTWVLESIQAMPKTISEWIFPAQDGLPHRPQFCKKVIQRVCTKLEMGHITPHRLRASFATNLEQAGAPVTAIQELLGHKDLKTTRGYLETSMESKRKAQDSLSRQIGFAKEESRCV